MKRIHIAISLALSPLLAFVLFPLLIKACNRDIYDVSEQECVGTYFFSWQRPGTNSKDCVTLFADGTFIGPGLHAAEPAVQAQGQWRILDTPQGSMIAIGDLATSVSKTKEGSVTIHLPEDVGGNRCIKQ